MICEKCFHKELKKDKDKAMKDYNKKLKKEKKWMQNSKEE